MKSLNSGKKTNKRLPIAAAVLAIGIAITGTLAFTSNSQEKVNPFYGTRASGVRLHDDFGAEKINTLDTKKNVYVENYGQSSVIVRVKLYEYFKLDDTVVMGKPTATINDRGVDWGTHVEGADNTKTWEWTMGGGKYYLPTTNHDGWDATKPDYGDNFADADDVIGRTYFDGSGMESASIKRVDEFAGYNPSNPLYSLDPLSSLVWDVPNPTFKATVENEVTNVKDAAGTYGANANYGARDNENETEFVLKFDAVDETDPDSFEPNPSYHATKIEQTGNLSGATDSDKGRQDNQGNWEFLSRTLAAEVTSTLPATVITFAQWDALQGGDKLTFVGWIADSDGWYYWSQKLKPGEATGLLLSNIRAFNILKDWEYGIHAVMEAATYEEIAYFDDAMQSDEVGTANSMTAAANRLTAWIGTNVSAFGLVGTANEIGKVVTDNAGVQWLVMDINPVTREALLWKLLSLATPKAWGLAGYTDYVTQSIKTEVATFASSGLSAQMQAYLSDKPHAIPYYAGATQPMNLKSFNDTNVFLLSEYDVFGGAASENEAIQARSGEATTTQGTGWLHGSPYEFPSALTGTYTLSYPANVYTSNVLPGLNTGVGTDGTPGTMRAYWLRSASTTGGTPGRVGTGGNSTNTIATDTVNSNVRPAAIIDLTKVYTP